MPYDMIHVSLAWQILGKLQGVCLLFVSQTHA